MIDSIGRCALIISITCPALGNIPSTNGEMKSAPKQLKAILVQAKSCLPREEQEAATATSHALKVEMDFQILKQMR